MYLQQISLHRQLEDSANEQQTKGFIVLTHKKRASSPLLLLFLTDSKMQFV
jgi:hypothetical protein